MRSRSIIPTAVITLATLSSYADIQVKDGDRVAFLGDSITQGGNSAPGGYLHLVANGLKAAGCALMASRRGRSNLARFMRCGQTWRRNWALKKYLICI